jgi:hypothetical protein
MNCYYCETAPEPGLHLGSATASALCVSCGAGVCRTHSVAEGHPRKMRCVNCSKENKHG